MAGRPTSPRPPLILLGTAPTPVAGGISLAMGGYRDAARAAELDVALFETHVAGSIRGKVVPWARSLGRLRRTVRAERRRGATPVVLAHVGAWPSLVRKRTLLQVAARNGARTGVLLHAAEIGGYLDSGTGRALVRRALSDLDWIGVLTPWWQDRLRRAGLRAEVLANPVPAALERAARRPAKNPEGALRVVVLSRLVEGKGVETAIDAAAMAGVDLLVAGDGPARRKLERRARASAGGHVRFLGWLDDAGRASLLEDNHVLCHASTSDVLPMSVVEAMARGRPVVAVRHGSMPDVVPHGVAGLLSDLPTAGAVAQRLTALRELEARERLGAGGQRLVLERHAPAVVGAELADVVRRLSHTD